VELRSKQSRHNARRAQKARAAREAEEGGRIHRCQAYYSLFFTGDLQKHNSKLKYLVISMLVPKDGEDNLPWDELDPCCQKEIENSRRKREVNDKLRTVDRSLRRLQEQEGVLCVSDPSEAWRCFCCRLGGDYPALASLRQRLASVAEEREDESEGQNEEDDDDDSLLDDLDDVPLTPAEQERLLLVQEHQKQAQVAKAYGLGLHTEDSLEHILQYLEKQPALPLVLHFYQADSSQCALIDWLIEQRLAERYLGTRFRRIRYLSNLFTHPTLSSSARYQSWLSKLSNCATSGQGCILCIRGDAQNLLASLTDLDSLGDHFEDISRNLTKALDNAHVLLSDLPPLPILKLGLLQNSDKGNEDDREEEGEDREMFCDDPECTKRYKHEHVAKRSADGKLLTTASFIQQTANVKGTEALAHNAMLRM
jgi:hypothetical protein